MAAAANIEGAGATRAKSTRVRVIQNCRCVLQFAADKAGEVDLAGRSDLGGEFGKNPLRSSPASVCIWPRIPLCRETSDR